MASKITRSFVRCLKGRRYYGAQAQASFASEAVQTAEPKVSVSENGMTVVSVDSSLPVSRLALVIKAGARYENAEEIGITHFLRSIPHLSTQKMSSFMLVNVIEHAGGVLRVEANRDYMIYNIECPKGNISSIAASLGAMTLRPAYFDHEIAKVGKTLNYDLAVQQEQPTSRVFEALHQAAFRTNLGNSLYCPQHLTGSFTPELIQGFVERNFTADRMALVGIGVDNDLLKNLAGEFPSKSGSSAESTPAKYYGGELREFMAGEETCVAVATEGPSLSSKDMYAAGVLQMIIGSGAHVKWNSGSPSNRLTNAVATATDNECSLVGLNVNYSDSGLVGFFVNGSADHIGQGLKAAFQEFTKLTKDSLTDKDIEVGKYKLKAEVSMSMENGGNLLLDYGDQALRTGNIKSLDDVIQAIDQVKASDVNNIAKKMVSGKVSMATVGDLSTAPYLDQVFK